MLFLSKTFRFNGFLKILILISVVLLSINFILFYNLKHISYVHNGAPILQNGLLSMEKEKKETQTTRKKTGQIQCLISNLTTNYHNKIEKLKNGLGEFYLKTLNSSQFSKKYAQFQKTLVLHDPSDVMLNDYSYFDSGQLIKVLKNTTILKAANAKKGSQLKLHLHLSNNMNAIFKPKWYAPYEVIFGSVYSGKDRHFGEVVAFYLSILLDFKRVPVAVIRKLEINKLLLISDQALLETFISKNNYTCLYGVCPYCSPSDLLCTDSNVLEGSMITYLSSDYKLKINRHPWRRTYKCNLLAKWEVDDDYCSLVFSSKFYSNDHNKALIFDLIDASVFDFLIDNGDRHHYEYIERNNVPRLLFIDNGKSFGNPYVDHIDILAPLYQCCLLRNSTWNTLLHARGGNLSYWLRRFLAADPDVIIDEMHFKALDRRLILIFTVIKDCFKKKGMQNVIVNY